MFEELGVTDLVYPELEAGLEMARQVLLALHVPVTEVQRQTETLRQEYFTSSMSQSKPYQPFLNFDPPNSNLTWSGSACIRGPASAGLPSVHQKYAKQPVSLL